MTIAQAMAMHRTASRRCGRGLGYTHTHTQKFKLALTILTREVWDKVGIHVYPEIINNPTDFTS